MRKPDPEHLLDSVTALGAAPARTIVVGDSRIDAECGRRAGITSVLVDWGVPDAGHPRIDSFSALLGMIPDGASTTAGLLDHASRKDPR